VVSIALVGALSYSVWLKATKIVDNDGRVRRAGALSAAARDDLLISRTSGSTRSRAWRRSRTDLKNPLAAIAGLTELLERHATDLAHGERLHVVKQECERMGVTLRDYLALSRPLEDLVPVRQPLAPIVDRVLTLFEARARRRTT